MLKIKEYKAISKNTSRKIKYQFHTLNFNNFFNNKHNKNVSNWSNTINN